MVSIITLWSVVVFLDAIVISKVLKIMCMGGIIMILDKFGGMKLHVCCPFTLFHHIFCDFNSLRNMLATGA